MILAEALTPISCEEFISEYLGTRYLVVANRPGRFAHVVPWRDINDVLRHLRALGRVVLVRNGVRVPAAAYMSSPNHVETSYVDARKVEKMLAGGASLLVTQVDELLDDVQELAESCEELFRVAVGVNLYAGWRTDNAFDLHWDGHDTVILQVAGRKRWKVYEPTLLRPIGGWEAETPPRPVGEPVWEGVLQDGDLLYMPRGWWHVAYPLDEPTLHLTVGVQHRTGVDLLKWVASEARRRLPAREDVPHLHDQQVQMLYAAKLRELLIGLLADDVVERFMRVVDQDIRVRPRLGLPFTAMGAKVAVDADTPLRLTEGTRLYFESSGDTGTLRFRVGQTDWTCATNVAPALRLLRATRPTTLREMYATVNNTQHPFVHAIVMAMTSAEVLWADPATLNRDRADDQLKTMSDTSRGS